MFFNWGRRKRCQNRHCENRQCPNQIFLDHADVELEYEILCNPHRKSFELGLFNGNKIKVIRNNDFQNNIIVAVGESRYIISREIARNISVKESA